VSRLRILGRDAGFVGESELFSSVVDALATAKRDTPEVVDLSEMEALPPYAVAAVAALGALGAPAVRLVAPNSRSVHDEVRETGVEDFFRGSLAAFSSERVAAVGQLRGVSPSFADAITSAWERELGGSPGLRRRLADHVDEITRNALSHGDSPVGCIVAFKVDSKDRTVDLAVLDLGVGIAAHLRHNPQFSRLTNDEVAIIRATEEGVTGTAPGTLNRLGEPNSGVGLFELRQYCEGGGGTLLIASGESVVSFAAGMSPFARRVVPSLPGCLVGVLFSF
jgi:hypothetical protein